MFLAFGNMLMLFSAVPTARYGVALLVLLVNLPSLITVFTEGDIFTFPDAAGKQAWMSPTDSILPNVGPVEQPPQPVLPGMQLLYNALSILALSYFCKPAMH